MGLSEGSYKGSFVASARLSTSVYAAREGSILRSSVYSERVSCLTSAAGSWGLASTSGVVRVRRRVS